MIVPQTTMMKGTETNRMSYAIAVWQKNNIKRTPSRWTTEPEKDIPANRISAIYERWGKVHTRVLLLSNTVSGVRTAHQHVINSIIWFLPKESRLQHYIVGRQDGDPPPSQLSL
jgi:hypothetical protein